MDLVECTAYVKHHLSLAGRSDTLFSDDALGASYSTAMAILALTVEYRFLPIYQRDEPADPAKKKADLPAK